jgi:2-polyprenyl-6-methoxyphenol hydroxylase-like FAD-dependent oxidoreductase
MVATAVVIVGAGPTGLLLAGDLAAAGVACTVLERRAEETNLTRAFAVHARTLELLDARGLADDLVATGARVGVLRLFDKVEVDLSRLPTRFPFLLVTPQYHTERLLEERATALGAEIVHGAEVVGLGQDRGGVEVQVRAGDRVRTRHASYVVGADGVHSTVRQALGLPFPGRAAVRSVMLADVRLDDAPAEVLTANATGEGFAFIAPFGDGWFRIIAWDRRHQLPDSAPVDLGELRALTHRVLGSDFGMREARWMSRFHSDERQVPRYRVGRVFLAGDAAHVHSPAGGLGMNTGLQDAVNLGWKLAAVVNGWAPDGLLDTYQAEQHPVGRGVLRTSGTLLRVALLRPRALRAVRGLVGGVVARIGPVVDRAAGRLWGISLGYPGPSGGHRLAGTRARTCRWPPAGGRRGGCTRRCAAAGSCCWPRRSTRPRRLVGGPAGSPPSPPAPGRRPPEPAPPGPRSRCWCDPTGTSPGLPTSGTPNAGPRRCAPRWPSGAANPASSATRARHGSRPRCPGAGPLDPGRGGLVAPVRR